MALAVNQGNTIQCYIYTYSTYIYIYKNLDALSKPFMTENYMPWTVFIHGNSWGCLQIWDPKPQRGFGWATPSSQWGAVGLHARPAVNRKDVCCVCQTAPVASIPLDTYTANTSATSCKQSAFSPGNCSNQRSGVIWHLIRNMPHQALQIMNHYTVTWIKWWSINLPCDMYTCRYRQG